MLHILYCPKSSTNVADSPCDISPVCIYWRYKSSTFGWLFGARLIKGKWHRCLCSICIVLIWLCHAKLIWIQFLSSRINQVIMSATIHPACCHLYWTTKRGVSWYAISSVYHMVWTKLTFNINVPLLWFAKYMVMYRSNGCNISSFCFCFCFHGLFLMFIYLILIDCVNCRYRGCEPLVLSCPSCSGTFGCSPILTSVCTLINTKPADQQAGSTNDFWHKLRCPRCPEEGDGGRISPAIIANQVIWFSVC